MQSTRSESKTMMAAIGALSANHEDRLFHFKYIVVEKTNSDTVQVFLHEIISNLRVPIEQVVVVLDNHAAHHSKQITKFAAE